MSDNPFSAPLQGGVQVIDDAFPEVASLLAEAGLLFNTRLQIDEIVALVVKLVAERMQADCVYLTQVDADMIEARAWHGVTHDREPLLRRALAKRQFSLREYLAGQTLGRGKVLFVPQLEAVQDQAHPVLAELGEGSLIGVPIPTSNDQMAVLLAARPIDRPAFTTHELGLLQALALQVTAALVNARTLAGERWQRQKAELMFQASKAVHTELHFDQAVREIALLLKQAIKLPWVGLMEYQPADQAMLLLGSTSEPAVDLRFGSQRLSLAEWPEALAAMEETQAPQAIPLATPLAQAIGQPGARAWAFPLIHKQAPQGLMLLLTARTEKPFPVEAQEVAVGIAELVALAIANQHLMDQEAKARIQIIRSQAAAQEREVLLRQIVHDLRNATQAMSLVVEDIELATGDDPELQKGLMTLNSQITFISNFLKEKLTWIQQGDRINPQQVTPMADVFADLESRFGPVARAKHQRLVVSAPEPIKVPLSAVQLEQIIGNLLDNAIKYTPTHGEIRLWADVSDGWVTIYVADNGPGIPPADQPHIGEVGYRGQQTEDCSGTGLGLANVRQLVTRAGGLFGLSSRDGTGTTFHVSLPTTTWGRVIS